jgi:nickel/cobalt transporter (NicO) family protein
MASRAQLHDCRTVSHAVEHGLAGSAGIALLAATTIGSRPLAVAYLGLVALGTVVGMVALTMVMAKPMTWAMRREGFLKHLLTVTAALMSMALGLGVLLGAGFPEGA